MPAFCKAKYLAMLARAHVHNCMFPGKQGLGFEEGTTSSQVVSAHFFWSALCHPAAPALLQHLTAMVAGTHKNLPSVCPMRFVVQCTVQPIITGTPQLPLLFFMP